MRHVWAMLFLAPLRAWAGDFCGSIDGPEVLRMLDRYAAGKPVEFNVRCIEQSFGDPLPPPVRARVLKACTTALGLPPARRDADVDPYCVHTVALSGVGNAGGRDLVAELMAFGGDWDSPPPYETLVATRDPRVRPFVLDAVAQARAGWAKQRKRPGWAKDQWARHRARALDALGQVGTAEDLAVIDALAADGPADRRVTAAALRARRLAGAR